MVEIRNLTDSREDHHALSRTSEEEKVSSICIKAILKTHRKLDI
jgi:hypothetical protein